MKLNTLTNLILTAVATAGISTAAFAANKASFDTQLTVDSVNNCQFTVTPENGTSMTVTYKYTAADQAAGDFGTTTLDTTAPLTVLVSSGSDTCPLGQFTVATKNPGIKIAKNTAGIPTHDGGVWPVRWVYTGFDAYQRADGTTPVNKPTGLHSNGSGWNYSSLTDDNDCTLPAEFTVVNHREANQFYGPAPYSRIPALFSSARGGHIRDGNGLCDTAQNSTNGPYVVTFGALAVAQVNDQPVKLTNLVVTPDSSARSVRISLAQLIATFPYSTTSKAPDPLTVYDTVNGGGVPLSGAGTMTITAL